MVMVDKEVNKEVDKDMDRDMDMDKDLGKDKDMDKDMDQVSDQESVLSQENVEDLAAKLLAIHVTSQDIIFDCYADFILKHTQS